LKKAEAIPEDMGEKTRERMRYRELKRVFVESQLALRNGWLRRLARFTAKERARKNENAGGTDN